eukprot:scaffold900_cov399-Pavlova_lutheri.AAC.16
MASVAITKASLSTCCGDMSMGRRTMHSETQWKDVQYFQKNRSIALEASFTRKGYQLNMDKSDVSHFVELACSEIHTHNLVKDSIPHVMELRDA